MNTQSRKLRMLLVLVSVAALVSVLAAVTLAQPDEDGGFVETEIPQSDTQIYLIRLEAPPLAAYRGGINGLAATSPQATGMNKLDAESPESVAYLDYLANEQTAFIASMEDVLDRSVEVVYQYRAANNGLAVRLTGDEAEIVENLPNVVFIQEDFERELQTDNGPAWIGAPGIWDGTETGGLPGTMGEGIIIGIIDTGINPSNPSFADVGMDGYDHSNPWGPGNYVGVCDSSDPSYDPTFPCNDKLIGAWGYSSVNSGDPRDYDGHGSHTASTAGGNFVYTATVEAPTKTITRSISGVAPHANIVAYAACCTGSALSAAIDQVVLDGVDVVNYSIGSSTPSDPWNDFDAVGYLNARDANIFVATSAGNDGPGPDTVGSPADVPWLLSVGASTHDRKFLNSLTSMTGGNTTPPPDLDGKSITVGYGPAPIVHAEDVGDGQCLNPFPANTWTNGEIVVCDRGQIARVEKGQNVLAGGAGGFVLANTDAQGEGINADAHYLPAVHLGDTDSDLLRAWLDSGSGHMATIAGTMLDEDPANGDVMASFSSRGSNRALPDIVAPSVTAPGVDIIAAYGTNDSIEWNSISGTSMASPHAAGVAALMKALHPGWSPAEIQSAIMTTAWTDVMDTDGVTPADPFDMGNGRIDLHGAAQAGLVLDETTSNYWAADPSIGGDPKTLNLASMGNAKCVAICSWERTVESTLSVSQTWEVSTSSHPSITLDVSPITFTLDPGMAQTVVVTANVASADLDIWHFGEVVISPTMAVAPPTHMPVAVAPSGASLPDEVAIVTDQISGTETVEDIQVLNEISDLTVEVAGLATADRHVDWLYEDPTNGNAFDDLDDVMVAYTNVPSGALRLVAEVIKSDSPDVDLYVGTGDTPSNGSLVCVSASSSWSEYCNIDDPATGTWWILVQNWDGSAEQPDYVALATAVVEDVDVGNMTVTGPASVSAGDPFDLDVNWDDPTMIGGDRLYGVFTLGTDAGNPGNVGSVDVNLAYLGERITKSGPEMAAQGDIVTYTVLIETSGPISGTAMMTDVLPVGVSYVSGTVTTTHGTAWYDANDNAVYWNNELPSLLAPASPVLWEQVADGSGSGIVSDYDLDSGLGAYTADDFTNDYPWTIDTIFVDGFVNTDDVTDAESITWYIYPDANGEPAGYPSDGGGTEIWTYTALVTDTAVTIDNDTITLDIIAAQGAGVDLPPGTYWLSVYPSMDLSVYERWNWYKSAPTIGNGAMLYDDGLFGGFPWTPLSGLVAGWTDQAFRLEGTADTPPDHAAITFNAEVTGSLGDVIENTAWLNYNGDMSSSTTEFEIPESRLAVAHLAPFAMDPGTAVTVTLDGTAVLTDFMYADSTGYLSVPSGMHDVAIYPSGTMTPAISGTVDLMAGMDYSAIAIGDGANQPLDLMVLEDDNTAPISGTFKLRLGHLAPFTDTITNTVADIRLQDGSPVITGVPYGTVSGYIELPAGTYDLKVTTPGGGDTLIDPLPVTFSEGDIVSAFAVGDGMNQELGAFAWPADQPGFLLPLGVEIYLPVIFTAPSP